MDKADFANYAVVITDKSGEARPLFDISNKDNAKKSIQEFSDSYSRYDKPVQIIAAHKLNLAAQVYDLDLPETFPNDLLKEPYPDHTGANVLTINDIRKWDERYKQGSVQPDNLVKVAADTEVRYIMGTYPVFDEESFKKASSFFIQTYHSQSPEWRRQYAKDFVKIAEEMKRSDVAYIFYKYAGDEISPFLKEELMARARAVENKEMQSCKMSADQVSLLQKEIGDLILETVPKIGKTTPLADAYKVVAGKALDGLDSNRIITAIELLDILSERIYDITFGKDAYEVVFAPKLPGVEDYVIINGKKVTAAEIDWEKAASILTPHTYKSLTNNIGTLYNIPESISKKLIK